MAVTDAGVEASQQPQQTILGLPVKVWPVSIIGVFESFAFWGTQTVLVFYVYFAVGDGGLGLPTSLAIAVASAYGGSVFLATVFTGWVADRLLGAERTLRLGAVVAFVGYALLAVLPGAPGLIAGLVGIAFGTAAMWVSEGTLVDAAVADDEPKRDAAFTVYYLATATGALLGITLAGVFQSTVGFRVGFGITAVALLIGLAIYFPFRKGIAAIAPAPSGSAARSTALVVAVVLVVVLALVGATVIGVNPALIVLVPSVILALVFFTRFFVSDKVSHDERAGIRRYVPFFVATLIFCALYQQLYTTVAIYSEENTDRFLFGLELPASTILAIAPLCTIVVAPILATIWGRLGDRQPALSSKYAGAFAFCAIGLGLLAAASGSSSLTPLIVLATVVFIFGASDMVISPAGLSMATSIAPKSFQAQTLSLHYLAVAIGASVAGLVGELYHPGENETAYFWALSATAVFVAIFMVFVSVASRRRAVAR